MNTNKEVNWFFHWIEGGYNSVLAVSKEAALKKAVLLAGHTILHPDPDSFIRDPDCKRTLEANRMYAGMFD